MARDRVGQGPYGRQHRWEGGAPKCLARHDRVAEHDHAGVGGDRYPRPGGRTRRGYARGTHGCVAGDLEQEVSLGRRHGRLPRRWLGGWRWRSGSAVVGTAHHMDLDGKTHQSKCEALSPGRVSINVDGVRLRHE